MPVNVRNILISLAIANNGDWNSMYSQLERKEGFDTELSTDENVITFVDKNYPDRLKQVFKPPFVLFYKGDISLLNNDNIVSIVFTREPTNEGLTALKTIASEIDVGVCSKNIDYIKRPIVVLPHGLDIDKDLVADVLARNGLVLSEYPNGVVQTPETCQARTRIIEAIAHKTLVIEATKYSSALLRVNYSLQLGHEVYVVPHSVGGDFINNTLLSEGAICCTEYNQLCA